MANTDKKDGFTAVPNKIFDAVLAQRLTSAQTKALLYIVRYTIGYQRPDAWISISKMANETGYTRRAMIGAVHDLNKMGIIKMGQIRSGCATSMFVNDPSYWDKNL